MLHGNFNMLKEFVEVEQAWQTYWFDREIKKTWCERHMPFYGVFYKFRKPEFGIKHFEWAATLDDPSLPPHERSEAQAEAAREILALYKWWVTDRPARVEVEHRPYDRQGLDELGCFDDDFDREAPDYKAYRESLDAANVQEEAWNKEDDEMLIRLIKIRRGLWT
jgi:hypothetical protein